MWLHVAGGIPQSADARDKHTADAWVQRNAKLIRHPRSVPGARGGGVMAEPTTHDLASAGFLTPPSVHFIHHHSPVPILDADSHKLSVMIIEGGRRHRNKTSDFTLPKLRKMEVGTATCTLASAGLRGAELSSCMPSAACSQFGPCALATGIWTGVTLVDVLARCGVKSCNDYDANIIFRGPAGQIGLDGGTPYESCMPLAEALDPKRNVIIAFERNGQELTADLGAPLRLIVPGAVEERCVKWLSTIVVGKHGAKKGNDALPEPSTFFFKERTRLYPSQARDASEATGMRVDSIPVNSALLVPAHGEILRIDPYKPQNVVLRGWAYSGGGSAISGVEVSLDRGLTWCAANLDGNDDAGHPFFFNRSTRPEYSWCWTLWTLQTSSPVLMHYVLADGFELWLRATDSKGNTQPEEAPWNFLGVCNNGYYKVKACVEVVETANSMFYEVQFVHPCARNLDGKSTGWMDKGIKPALSGKAAAAVEHPSALLKTLSRRREKDVDVASPPPAAPAAPAASAEEAAHVAEPNAPPATAVSSQQQQPGDPGQQDQKSYTWEEIAEHDKDDDIWIVVDNVVYDVTEYLEKHPGGAASITMNAGEDTTDDFTAIHSNKAWDDLAHFRIGIVAGSSPPQPSIVPPALPVITAIEPLPKPSLDSTLHSGDGGGGGSRDGTSNNLASLFLSKTASKLRRTRSGMLRRVESFYRKSTSDTTTGSAAETPAKAELAAYKRMVSPFATFPVTQAPMCLNPRKWVPVTLSELHWISPDTVLVRFALTSPQHVLGLPTGQHFMIKGKDGDGKPVIRAYTPTSPNTDVGFVDLVIKVYFPSPEYPMGGKLSQFIGALHVGDTIDIKGPIGEITYLGRGKFTIHKIGEVLCKRITLIGAGTGITPLLQIAAACLRDAEDDTKLRLVFANRHEEDILCRRIVDQMVEQYPRQFEAHYVLSKPPEDWVMSGKGSAGRVNLSILRQHGFPFEASSDPEDPGAVALTCGSDAFNEHAAFGNLLQMGYPRERMFAF